MEKKTCRKCDAEKPISEFHKKKDSRDGRHSFCKQCAIAGAKKHYADNADVLRPKMAAHAARKRRQLYDLVNSIKEETGCALCDEGDPCCLDFHHVNDDKDREVAYLVVAKNLTRLIREINKCVCVCANCHRKIHAGKLSTSNLSTMLLKESEIKARMQTLELEQ